MTVSEFSKVAKILDNKFDWATQQNDTKSMRLIIEIKTEIIDLVELPF